MQMRINVEIDDTLMAETQKACGQATKKQTVEQALRLMIRLLQQRDIDLALANISGAATSPVAAKGEGLGDSCRQQHAPCTLLFSPAAP
jgi:Arc/MetJ family transcription regulator